MESLFDEIPPSQMTLYGIGIDSPVFLDLNEYENFPEDGICGHVGERAYLNYDVIDTIDYLGSFDGKSDVFKKTSKTGEVTFYALDIQDGIPYVLEGKISSGKLSWYPSSIDDLRYTYKGFRERGIVFEYDFYKIMYDEYKARENQALLNMQYLQEMQSFLNEKNSAGLLKEQENLPSEPDSSPRVNGVIGLFKKFIKKDYR